MGFTNTSIAAASASGGPTAGGVGTAGNILGIAGTITSGIGAYYNAKAQQSALDYQASVAESNARIAERAAQSTLLQGQQKANQVQIRTAQLEGAQRSSFAANGIDLGEGSAARVLATTKIMGDIDVETTQANALRSAWGYRTQGTNFQNDALMKNASADSISPFGTMSSSLLTGASSVARNWYLQSKAGVGADGTGAMYSQTGDMIRARR